MDKTQEIEQNRSLLGELHAKEIDLLLTLRHKYPFGKVEISMRDGIPDHLLKTIERTNLGTFEVIHKKSGVNTIKDVYLEEE